MLHCHAPVGLAYICLYAMSLLASHDPSSFPGLLGCLDFIAKSFGQAKTRTPKILVFAYPYSHSIGYCFPLTNQIAFLVWIVPGNAGSQNTGNENGSTRFPVETCRRGIVLPGLCQDKRLLSKPPISQKLI